jgi:hypothetical protein
VMDTRGHGRKHPGCPFSRWPANRLRFERLDPAYAIRAPRKIETSAILCESELWQQDSGCGHDGAIRIF